MNNESSALPESRRSRYTFTEIAGEGAARGVRIEGEDRNTVFVAATPTCLLVRYKDTRGAWHMQPYGFFDYYPFAGDVASGLILGWEPPEGRPGWPGVHWWVWRRTGQTIGKRLYAFYRRCLCEVNPAVLALQRSVFAATLSAPGLMLREELYKHKYVVRDVTQHRAAAVALANLGRFRYLYRRTTYLNAQGCGLGRSGSRSPFPTPAFRARSSTPLGSRSSTIVLPLTPGAGSGSSLEVSFTAVCAAT